MCRYLTQRGHFYHINERRKSFLLAKGFRMEDVERMTVDSCYNISDNPQVNKIKCNSLINKSIVVTVLQEHLRVYFYREQNVGGFWLMHHLAPIQQHN